MCQLSQWQSVQDKPTQDHCKTQVIVVAVCHDLLGKMANGDALGPFDGSFMGHVLAIQN